LAFRSCSFTWVWSRRSSGSIGDSREAAARATHNAAFAAVLTLLAASVCVAMRRGARLLGLARARASHFEPRAVLSNGRRGATERAPHVAAPGVFPWTTSTSNSSPAVEGDIHRCDHHGRAVGRNRARFPPDLLPLALTVNASVPTGRLRTEAVELREGLRDRDDPLDVRLNPTLRVQAGGRTVAGGGDGATACTPEMASGPAAPVLPVAPVAPRCSRDSLGSRCSRHPLGSGSSG